MRLEQKGCDLTRPLITHARRPLAPYRLAAFHKMQDLLVLGHAVVFGEAARAGVRADTNVSHFPWITRRTCRLLKRLSPPLFPSPRLQVQNERKPLLLAFQPRPRSPP